jgi:FtsZ-interacting cell division protein ZipA
MSALRWILLILGIVLIAGVYFYGMRGERGFRRKRREPALDNEFENTPQQLPGDEDDLNSSVSMDSKNESGVDAGFDNADWLDFETLVKEAAPADLRKTSSPGAHAKQPSTSRTAATSGKSTGAGQSVLLDGELVVLHAFAREPQKLRGFDLYLLMDEFRYVRGPLDVFYKIDSDDACLVANAFKPGTFPESPQDFETRGVSLVLQLAKTDSPLDMFDELLVLAHALQERLDCRLYDAQRSSLTGQTVTYLRDEIQQYQFRRGL